MAIVQIGSRGKATDTSRQTVRSRLLGYPMALHELNGV